MSWIKEFEKIRKELEEHEFHVFLARIKLSLIKADFLMHKFEV